ncbi:MAG: transcription elongation factor GreAB [Streptosporangiales bacterium]|nr:transcription elongation factor GreAB [Streptosporangiales bacterium]
MTTSARTWLTRQAFEQLHRELDQLLGQPTAGAEPSGTTAGEFDQEPVISADRRAARIRQIEDLLQHAVVDETPPDDGVAEPGMVLTIRFDDTAETTTFLLSVRHASEPTGLDVYSPESPLGAALYGATEGEQRTYAVPSGATVRVTLLRAVPYGHHREAGGT